MPRQTEQIALALLIATVVVINISWIRQDQSRMMKQDCYAYLTLLLRFVDGLASQTSLDFWTLLGELSQGGRAPLYQLLTVPFVLLFGRSEDVALSVNNIFLIILMISTYKIGQLTYNGKAGLLGALLIASYPPIVHLSRTYLPHGALPACVALSLWVLILLTKQRSIKLAWLFGATLAFGLLMHPYFLWVMAAPTVVFGIYMLLSQVPPQYPGDLKHTPVWLWARLKSPFALHGLLPGALIVLALTLPWYLTKGYRFFAETRAIVEDRGAKISVFGFPDVESPLWFWIQTTPGAISGILTAFVVIGMVFALSHRRAPTSVLAFTLLAAYATYTYTPTPRMWWYFAPMLPVAASLSATWIVGIHRRWLASALTIVAVASSAFNYSVVTWGARPWSRTLAINLGSPLQDGTCRSPLTTAFCPAPPEADRWSAQEILGQILNDPTCRRGRPCRLMIAGPLWQQRVEYLLVRDRTDNHLKVATPAPDPSATGFDFEALLKSDYLLYPDPQIPRTHSFVSASVRFLQSPPAAFADAHQTVAVFEYGSGGARLIQRVTPLTAEEAEFSIEALELPARDKSRGDLLLAALYVSEGRTQEAAELYSRAAKTGSRALTRREAVKMYRSLGRFEEVIPLLKDGLEANPLKLASRVELAAAYHEIGNSDAAIAELETAIALAPDDARPRRALAQIYRKLGRVEQALTAYRKALELNPEYLAARLGLGKTYRQIGDVDAAIVELEMAIALAPDNPRPRKRLAADYLSAGREAEAVALYRQILELDPDDAAARRALSRLEER